ncbi:hypothetical protein PoB_004809200 [Plakobranchus ocellatus]|uniref:Uncharacterized protein n=1 Tax=Plakobranchus ocellatus TaxID=259542 RepID=A0AAV4BRH2_9GAST|nr:hypothetical protein PoB_004809200 [Plakobranchus ocellatus]
MVCRQTEKQRKERYTLLDGLTSWYADRHRSRGKERYTLLDGLISWSCEASIDHTIGQTATKYKGLLSLIITYRLQLHRIPGTVNYPSHNTRIVGVTTVTTTTTTTITTTTITIITIITIFIN